MVDDFGIGYFSLVCVYEFLIDWLKIECCFVCDLCENGKLVLIIKIIFEMVKNFNIFVVVEGIEDWF